MKFSKRRLNYRHHNKIVNTNVRQVFKPNQEIQEVFIELLKESGDISSKYKDSNAYSMNDISVSVGKMSNKEFYSYRKLKLWGLI